MKPRKYTPSKRVRSHIAKWEASDFAGLNAAFGGDAVGAKAIELMNMLGDKANAFTDNELDGLLSTYYNLSPKGFRKTLMPYIDAYAADLSDLTRMKLDQAMRNRWTIAALKYLKGIRRRAAADADLMGLKYNLSIIEQPDAVRVKPVVPEENTRTTWSGAEDTSPYVTGRPTLNMRPRILLPTVEEVLEDSAWQPPFPRLKPAYKNGRLPKYGGGRTPITTGGAGVTSVYQELPTSEEAQPVINLLERAANFMPYVGTILDWELVAGGNLQKIPSAIIGTVADAFLPGLRSSYKAAKAYKAAYKTVPKIADKIKYYKASNKAYRDFSDNVGFLLVGSLQDIIDDQLLAKPLYIK